MTSKSLETEFLPGTVVRIIPTGRFARIVKRCVCGSLDAPLHYDAIVYYEELESERPTVLNHDILEVECLPV